MEIIDLTYTNKKIAKLLFKELKIFSSMNISESEIEDRIKDLENLDNNFSKQILSNIETEEEYYLSATSIETDRILHFFLKVYERYREELFIELNEYFDSKLQELYKNNEKYKVYEYEYFYKNIKLRLYSNERLYELDFLNEDNIINQNYNSTFEIFKNSMTKEEYKKAIDKITSFEYVEEVINYYDTPFSEIREMPEEMFFYFVKGALVERIFKESGIKEKDITIDLSSICLDLIEKAFYYNIKKFENNFYFSKEDLLKFFNIAIKTNEMITINEKLYPYSKEFLIEKNKLIKKLEEFINSFKNTKGKKVQQAISIIEELKQCYDISCFNTLLYESRQLTKMKLI